MADSSLITFKSSSVELDTLLLAGSLGCELYWRRFCDELLLGIAMPCATLENSLLP